MDNDNLDRSGLEWFNERRYWVIRKVPNTKDQYYVASSTMPPDNVLKIYGIK